MPINPEPRARSAVNLRSVALGLLGVVLMSAITPFNDWAVSNTYLIGSYLPIGLVLYFMLFVLAVNGPLTRFKPGLAFSGQEIAVALGMVLVGCAAPSSGLMRYLCNGLIGVNYLQTESGSYAQLVETLRLPKWMFPAMDSPGDPVVMDYWGRAATDDHSFLGHFLAVPWSAWVKPAIAWGIFAGAMWGAILCGAAIVRKQWIENERLPFPLAGVYLSLIEPPQKGRILNTLFRSRGFWIAASFVFAIHALNALALYSPKFFPKVPIAYDARAWLANAPWSFIDAESKYSQIYFAVIGLTFFVQSKIAFSLWFFFLALSAAQMIGGSAGGGREITTPMLADQLFGAVIPFALMILWIGRHHWATVLRAMFGRMTNDEGRMTSQIRNSKFEIDSSFVIRNSNLRWSYMAAGWGLIACAMTMIAWLIATGASVLGAIVIVMLMLMTFLCIARVVAETGLMLGQLPVPLNRPFVYAATLPAAIATRTSPASFFLASFFSGLFTRDVRENLAVYATHAMKIVDSEKGAEPSPRGGRGAFGVCLVLALVVAFFVSGASQLYTEYTHAVTLDSLQKQPLDLWSSYQSPKWLAMDPSAAYARGSVPPENHNRLGHFGFGAAVTGLLSVLRLRFTWWPLHPVGFLLCSSYVMQKIWASIFLGWLAKVLILRFGGANLFHASRNLFLGLVIGEASASAFWLIVSLLRVAMGLDYRAIRLFPA